MTRFKYNIGKYRIFNTKVTPYDCGFCSNRISYAWVRSCSDGFNPFYSICEQCFNKYKLGDENLLKRKQGLSLLKIKHEI